jgi:hypothetical protein
MFGFPYSSLDQAQLQKSGDSYRTLKTNHTVYIHPSSNLFQSQPPVRTVLYYELVMTSKSYMRYVDRPTFLMDIDVVYVDKSWKSSHRGYLKVHVGMSTNIMSSDRIFYHLVAPHYFNVADVEQLGGDKKLPKAVPGSGS